MSVQKRKWTTSMCILLIYVILLNHSVSVFSSSYAAEETLEKEKDTRRLGRMCTTIAVSNRAMETGATVTTHNNDCVQCDQRVTHVPARDWADGSMRPIFPFRVAYPRYLEMPEYNIHGPEYLTANTDIYNWNYSDFKPIGYITQVEHTYGYTLGTYGIMNEKQLSIGESTCPAKLYAFAVNQIDPFSGEQGKALFNIIPLTEIALERCKTARCAIETIGALAEEYGFYGDITFPFEKTLAQNGAGESLTIADTNEVWMFHILPDDRGTSAIWVAQKIPDGHISVCANQFVINEIDFDDKNSFLYSKNVVDVAIRSGLYDPNTASPFSFSAAYAVGYGVQGYESWRRVWRVFTLAAPSIYLSPYTDDFGSFGYGRESKLPYPFSVKVDKLLSLESIKNMTRDNFEGTPFSMYEGPAAGPMGDPIRYQPLSNLTSGDVKGVSYDSWQFNGYLFNRPISLWKTSYSHISQSRRNTPDEVGALSWIAQYAPHHSVFIPVYAAAATTPSPMYVGTLYKMDRRSNWWTFCLLSNYLSRWFKWTIGSVRAYQQKMETMLETSTAEIEQNIVEMLTSDSCVSESNKTHCLESSLSLLEEFQTSQASLVHDQTWDFFWNMTGSFRDQLWVVNPHVGDFLYAYDYMEVERWVFELMGYWGAPGTPPTDAHKPVSYHPINIPTLPSATSAKSYSEAYPNGFFEPYEDFCFDASNSINFKTETSSMGASEGGDGTVKSLFLCSIISFAVGSIFTFYVTKKTQKGVVKYMELA